MKTSDELRALRDRFEATMETPQALYEWLKSKPAHEPVGMERCAMQCPIANMLLATFPEASLVEVQRDQVKLHFIDDLDLEDLYQQAIADAEPIADGWPRDAGEFNNQIAWDAIDSRVSLLLDTFNAGYVQTLRCEDVWVEWFTDAVDSTHSGYRLRRGVADGEHPAETIDAATALEIVESVMRRFGLLDEEPAPGAP